MKKMHFSEAVSRSQGIREIYHRLELQYHGSEWTVEEDALAFLTDAALVGRLTMAHQHRWPIEDGKADDLEHKLGECIWWLIVLAQRMEIDAEHALESFLAKTEQQMNESHAPTSPQRKDEQPGPAQPATKPADKAPAKAQPSTHTSKDGPP
jgi:hypothetical protein